MAKYINADTVIQALRETIEKHKDSEMFTRTVRAAGNMIRIIDQMPSADVVEAKHGKWVNPEMGYEDCSVCGYCLAVYDDNDFQIERNFCPNCGADMRERKETE